jgi:hypothetical protein
MVAVSINGRRFHFNHGRELTYIQAVRLAKMVGQGEELPKCLTVLFAYRRGRSGALFDKSPPVTAAEGLTIRVVNKAVS